MSKITLLQEQERRLKMIHDVLVYISDYDLVLTYPSQIEEFKEDLKDLFKASRSRYNASITICLQKNLIESLREDK